MDRRYQIFISSTYLDLKEERRIIIQTLLNANYIPAGMELFNASDEDQFSYIKKIIDICDYYILIIGGRYGSINPFTGVSYTEQEYDYARLKNIPVLAFIRDNPNNLPEEKRDENLSQLNAFLYKVKENRLCKIWTSTNDLVSSVIISLNEYVKNNPQQGWIRGSRNFDNRINEINIKQIQKNEEKLVLLAKRFINLSLNKNKKVITKIFSESIAFDIAKYIRDVIQTLSKSQKEQIQLVLESVYKNNIPEKRLNADIIREQCCYFMSFLQMPHSYNFLYNTLKNDKSLFVIRGVYVGLLLNNCDNNLLVDYLIKLNNNPLIASINAGYHQGYYGDKFFSEGYLFSENVNNTSSILALLSHFSNQKYKTIRAIDIFTLRYFIYYNSTSILPISKENLLELINKNISISSEEIMEHHKLLKFLYSICNLDGIDYYFCEDLYVKKLPNDKQVVEIYQEYYESVYIDGEFFPHLNKRNYAIDFKERLEKDKLKAKELIDIIINMDIFRNASNIKMLDIGCGYGSMIYYWKKCRLGEAVGIEISECAKLVASNVYNDIELDIITIDANNIEEVVKKYKPRLICCFDFFEHCFNIELFLYNISNVDKGTYLLIYIPIIEKDYMSIDKLVQYKYFTRNHIYYFTYEGLINFVNKYGFEYICDTKIKEYKYVFVFQKK